VSAGLSPELLRVLACPACRGALDDRGPGLRCASCSRTFDAPAGIPCLTRGLDARTAAVRDFYEAAPFPGYPPRDTYATLRARAERSAFARALDRAIPADATVLDLGCGTGQMTLFLATGERRVVGADLTRASLLLAAGAARRFELRRAWFVETDLGAPGLRDEGFDVVHCSGVLHHTPDPRAAFSRMVRLVRPGGTIVVGLYNAYARLPHRVRRALARWTGFRWVPRDEVLRDRDAEPARREAWFRDQYRHPLEHRHTLSEVRRWFAAAGVEYLRTYPSALLGGAEEHADLFTPDEDCWGLESVLAQLSWAASLGREGGLFVTIGRRARASER
jgi:SAM-dependent methyltransferase